MHDLHDGRVGIPWVAALREAGWARVANDVYVRGGERIRIDVRREGRIVLCMRGIAIEVDDTRLVDWVVRRLR
jgi:hypothetical protein